ncbi:MAG TPA: glycosyltransferase [Fibrobacteria bacterium]|nr:glycosyltransferase [Fibrobacteria bacterium]HOX50048.1 glycosyltransferase [Fibrobacteria bacterium]
MNLPGLLSDIVEMGFLAYFLALSTCTLALNALAAWTILRYLGHHPLLGVQRREAFGGFLPPVSVIVPAYNEEGTIAATIHSLLQLNYPQFEIIVVNDGSKDGTLKAAVEAFGLQEFREVHRHDLATRKVRAVYRSLRFPNLRFIDKENGGKADALNAGINASIHPLFCGIDADSILQQDSLVRCVQPFLEDPATICAGGTIRIANGCRVEGGFLVSTGLPTNPLALAQVVEYLRAFLFGRLAWSPLNALLVVSGAFGIFHRETVVEAGGYSTGTIGEDMELVVRLHATMLRKKRRYRIVYLPDPICWTEAPESLGVLANQRVRWQRGLAESLWRHRRLLFSRGSGAVGFLSMPFLVLFELLEPLVEVGGIAFFVWSAAFGEISWSTTALFFALVVALGFLQSINAVFLEEASFRQFKSLSHIGKLLASAVLENIGYRQLNTWWRLKGLLLWLAKTRQKWGTMTRSARWSAG